MISQSAPGRYRVVERGLQVHPGAVYGRWTVLEVDAWVRGEGRKALCRCSCGTLRRVDLNDLKRGQSKRCASCRNPSIADSQSFEMALSAEDMDIKDLPWRLHKGYARCNKDLYAHRLVLERILERKLNRGEVCDHINGIPLDNRRENIRLTNTQGNSQNRRETQKNSTSGKRGVTFQKSSGKWMAYVRHNYKSIYVGLYEDVESAAKAAADKRMELGFLEGSSNA